MERPWTIKKDGVPKGNIKLIDDFESKTLNNKRRIWIYTPAGYDKMSNSLPVALFTDGWEYVNITKVITTFDNLIAEGKIPDMCIVFVESNDDRDKELTCSDKFTNFVINEILPFVKKNYNIDLNSSKNLISGFSYGGLIAAYIAYKYPNIFPKVLCQSGGLSWPDDGEKGLILKIYEDEEKKDIDFFMTCGEFEKEFSLYKACKEFYEILKSKKYNVRY